MSAPTDSPDLLDLKMMPAWVNEPARTNEYADYEGETDQGMERRGRGPQRDRDSRPRRPGGPGGRPGGQQRDRNRRPDQRGPERRGPGPDRGERREGGPRRMDDRRPPREALPPLPEVGIRFLPHPAAFDSVIAQIKSGTVTYSVFALARMFLDKPERYNVQLTGTAASQLHQLGENGPVAVDPRILEGSAFATLKDDFYTVEVTQTEPIKGNFTNVARDRASGTLLGPTNHHAYQPQLRSLYEQRYSRRMSFQDFQRQIEIVSDPTVVEQWKEQARSVTVYRLKSDQPKPEEAAEPKPDEAVEEPKAEEASGVESTPEETPAEEVTPELPKAADTGVKFNSVADAERHFRQTYLPQLLRSASELTISGVLSRRLPDRGLGHVIENAWAMEIRSPSKMMQELANGLRGAGLNIFRHRRGMLFVSPIRIRSFGHDRTTVSPSINSILEKLTEAAGVNRKQLAEKLVEGLTDPAAIDRIKLSLASDLRWLISEGYVIEFNDGTLELPRAKAPQPAAGGKPPREQTPASAIAAEAEAPAPLRAENVEDLSPVAVDDVGGMAVEQTVDPAPPTAPEEPAEQQQESPAPVTPVEPESEEPDEAVPSPS